MALVLGHSQVKYVGKVFKDDRLVTLCYPGYKVRDFIEEPTPFDVIPFVSVVAVVVGANDLPWSTPDVIVNDVQTLCDEIRSENPSVTVILMEILPRAQNLFPGCRLTQQFISKFNAGATSVNDRLRKMARLTRNVEFVELREFYTPTGPNRKMLSRDGLHLSLHGTDVVACQLNELLKNDMKETVKSYIDTTYKLGDLFVTVLSYQHIIFEGSRVIPVAFMLHEKRDQKHHERFLKIIKTKIPNLDNSNHPIICDRETGISNAIKLELPNVQIIHCWNHLKQDVKRWLQGRKATKDDLQIYGKHVDTLLRCDDTDMFDEKYGEFKNIWSQEFCKYFDKHIKSAILNHSMKSILDKFNIYNNYSGITTNPAECVNNVLKSMQARRELPIDMIVLTMFFGQKYIHTEIQCSRAGIGKFKLKEEWNFAKINVEDIELINSEGSPEEILESVKRELESISDKISKFVEKGSELEKKDSEIPPTENIKYPVSDCSPIQHPEDNTCNNVNLNELNATLILDKEEEERKGREKFISQEYLAEKTIQDNKIFFVANMKAFMVEGVKSKKYVVTLDPNESCSCPSVGICYHIMAVNMALNRTTGTKKTPIKKNLSLLRKNSKPRVAKKTGQKKPRKTDFDITPAPDSKETLTPKKHVVNFCSPVSDSKLIIKTPTTENKRSILKRKLSMSEPSSKSKKRIRFETESTVSENNSFETSLELEPIIELNISRDDESFDSSQYWLENHGLLLTDKELISEVKGWLNDKHMTATRNILKDQFPSIQGIQSTLKIPHYCETTNTWNLDNPFLSIPGSSAQIHFNGYNHWLLSFRDDTNTIYVLDSLKSNRTLNSFIKIQLSQIYGNNNSNNIEVKVPHVQQQQNGSDCGVFAIAFLIELCFNNFTFNTNTRFQICNMREHLLTCLENSNFKPFPKVAKMPKMPVSDTKTHKITLYCKCQLPACIDDLVKCSNKKCSIQWYHKICVDKFVCDKWLCKSCKL